MTNNNTKVIVEIEGIRYDLMPGEWNDPDSLKSGEEIFQLSEKGNTYHIKVIEMNMTSLTCKLEINGKEKTVKIIRELDLMIEKMGLNAAQTRKQSTMLAPMPGLVTEIKVTAGQHVDKGTPLLILEAMKMENVISAPHDATVKAIRVKVGQAVDKEFPLIEFL